MTKVNLKEEWPWCDKCKKSVRIFVAEFPEVEGKPMKWIMINPHEHDLRVGMCPRTVWMTNDFKEEKFPILLRLFNALAKGDKDEALDILLKKL